jgi:Oxidoreductase family, NAD-binding Rossmann fold
MRSGKPCYVTVKPAKTESMGHVVIDRRAFLGFGPASAVCTGRAVNAVRISGPVHDRARLTIEACEAGKDVWVEAPVCLSLEDGVRMIQAARRHRRVVQAGTTLRSAPSWQHARALIRRGDLGRIAFVRMTGGNRVHLIDAVQFAFGEISPLSVVAQGCGKVRIATLHYAGFIASWEDGPAESVTFHGAHRTLTVGQDEARAAHWRNFMDCVRSRKTPVSDIATSVRSTAIELALRSHHSPGNLEISS